MFLIIAFSQNDLLCTLKCMMYFIIAFHTPHNSSIFAPFSSTSYNESCVFIRVEEAENITNNTNRTYIYTFNKYNNIITSSSQIYAWFTGWNSTCKESFQFAFCKCCSTPNGRQIDNDGTVEYKLLQPILLWIYNNDHFLQFLLNYFIYNIVIYVFRCKRLLPLNLSFCYLHFTNNAFSFYSRYLTLIQMIGTPKRN